MLEVRYIKTPPKKKKISHQKMVKTHPHEPSISPNCCTQPETWDIKHTHQIHIKISAKPVVTHSNSFMSIYNFTQSNGFNQNYSLDHENRYQPAADFPQQLQATASKKSAKHSEMGFMLESQQIKRSLNPPKKTSQKGIAAHQLGNRSTNQTLQKATWNRQTNPPKKKESARPLSFSQNQIAKSRLGRPLCPATKHELKIETQLSVNLQEAIELFACEKCDKKTKTKH